MALALDEDKRFADAGGKAFSWGLQEADLTKEANNNETRQNLWSRSLEWSGLKLEENLLVGGAEHENGSA